MSDLATLRSQIEDNEGGRVPDTPIDNQVALRLIEVAEAAQELVNVRTEAVTTGLRRTEPWGALLEALARLSSEEGAA